MRLLTGLVVLALGVLAGCERPHVEQRGYRGLGMLQVYNAETIEKLDEVNTVPKSLRKVSAAGPTAAESYQNVQVLGDLSKPEFARLMLSFKEWLAPDEGCGFCHNAPDYASDVKYTKQVARAMIVMTRHVNRDWQAHVKGTGVTCYTCHRGQAVPPKIWFSAPAPESGGLLAKRAAWPLPTPSASRSSLPVEALNDFLLDEYNVNVVTPVALPTGSTRSIGNARSTYALMTVMSESLGVNCTYCHNTQAFFNWNLSPPPRATAWYGIRMARDLNKTWLTPLAALLPPNRHGPAGDGPKLYCATCHMGASRPMNGAKMLDNFPELRGTKAERAAAADAASAPAGG
jgi:photosynthetic reaction center cytochrome c subunit